MTSPPRPVSVEPRFDPKPWGGRELAAWSASRAFDQPIGEALLTAPEAVVTSGEHAGTSLGDLTRLAPETWVGDRGLAATAGRAIFPLLVKLIDANADLSIQVHPDDRFAAAAGLGTGKTEAWHVLRALPGSVLYLGLAADATHDAFVQACRRADGSAARLLKQIRAEPGMTVVVPAGTAHAIGAGLLIYEIQQPSNVTFRLDDWGRVDALGQPRELHHDHGFAVLDAESTPPPLERGMVRKRSPRRELLAATRYFALERLAFAAGDRTPIDAAASPQVLTCHEGSIRLETGSWQASFRAGETLVVPVGIDGMLAATGSGVVLRGWVPDVEHSPNAAATEGTGAKRDLLDLAMRDDARAGSRQNRQ